MRILEAAYGPHGFTIAVLLYLRSLISSVTEVSLFMAGSAIFELDSNCILLHFTSTDNTYYSATYRIVSAQTFECSVVVCLRLHYHMT